MSHPIATCRAAQGAAEGQAEHIDPDEAERIVPAPPAAWAVPLDDLLAVLALPLDQQRQAAARTLGPNEWHLWKAIFDVWALPIEEQPHAAIRRLGRWSFGYWHRWYESQLARRRQGASADGKGAGTDAEIRERVSLLEKAVVNMARQQGGRR